jgi:ELWxxDGT repeat protein
MRAIVGVIVLVGAACWANTSQAAQLLLDINAIPTASPFTAMWTVDLPELTLFVFDDGIHGDELWATDGTPAGTRLVRDINPGPTGSGIREMTVVQGVAYFWADDGTNGVQLWRSDGTAAGTYLVANTWIKQSGRIGPPPVAMGGVVYFAADDGKSGNELWRSDGTAAGTYLLKDIAAGSAASNPTLLTAAGSQLYFVADDGVHGQEVWTSDGTVAGTHLLADIFPGATGSNPQQLLTVAGTLFFIASDSATSDTVWRAASDGSSAAAVPGISPMMVNGAHTSGLIQISGERVLFNDDGELYSAGVSSAATDLGPADCTVSTPCPA